MTPIEAIMRKEWVETLHNRTLVWSFVLVGVMFTIMPLIIAFGLPALAGEAMTADPDTGPMLSLLAGALPGFEALGSVEQFQVFALRQFLPLFLLLPIMGAMSIATYSIIGEKTSRSLEAVLATPTTTRQLLVGKALAASLPAVLGTWLLFLVFALVVWALGGPTVARFALDGTAWAMILLITPVIAFVALGLGVIVSSRATDPRSAQQIATLLILPVIALLIAQVTGLFLIGLNMVLVAAAVLLILAVIVLQVGVRLFQREAILTKWK